MPFLYYYKALHRHGADEYPRPVVKKKRRKTKRKVAISGARKEMDILQEISMREEEDLLLQIMLGDL